MKAFFITILLLPIIYCQTPFTKNGLPYFPFGTYIYGVSNTGEINFPDLEIAQGLNWVAPYTSTPTAHSNQTWTEIISFLDNCALVGMSVHYDIHVLGLQPNSTEKFQLLKDEISRVKDHPAVAGYYLGDEPGGQGISPEVLQETYDFIKTVDSTKPVLMVFCSDQIMKYNSSFDIGMADPYPIPNSDFVPAITNAIDLLKKSGKPFMMTPQMFGGGEWWRRSPSAQEERAMTYLCVIQGAIGIQYFVRAGPIEFPPMNAWNEIQRLALEVQELSSSILSENQGVKITSISDNLQAQSWGERFNNQSVVAGVNTKNQPQQFNIQLDTDYTGPVEVLFQNRIINMSKGLIQDIVSGYGSFSYRFPIQTSSNVDSKNLVYNPSYEEQFNIGTPDGNYLSLSSSGTSYFTDSRRSYDGLHSLRVTTTVEGQGINFSPFPIQFEANQTYEVSMYGMSDVEGLEVRFQTAKCLGDEEKVFKLTNEWEIFKFEVTASSKDRTPPLGYQLYSQGIAWLDLFQIVPISNDIEK